MTKRILTLVLALVMVLGMVPASMAEAVITPVVPEITPVCEHKTVAWKIVDDTYHYWYCLDCDFVSEHEKHVTVYNGEHYDKEDIDHPGEGKYVCECGYDRVCRHYTGLQSNENGTHNEGCFKAGAADACEFVTKWDVPCTPKTIEKGVATCACGYSWTITDCEHKNFQWNQISFTWNMKDGGLHLGVCKDCGVSCSQVCPSFKVEDLKCGFVPKCTCSKIFTAGISGDPVGSKENGYQCETGVREHVEGKAFHVDYCAHCGKVMYDGEEWPCLKTEIVDIPDGDPATHGWLCGTVNGCGEINADPSCAFAKPVQIAGEKHVYTCSCGYTYEADCVAGTVANCKYPAKCKDCDGFIGTAAPNAHQVGPIKASEVEGQHVAFCELCEQEFVTGCKAAEGAALETDEFGHYELCEGCGDIINYEYHDQLVLQDDGKTAMCETCEWSVDVSYCKHEWETIPGYPAKCYFKADGEDLADGLTDQIECKHCDVIKVKAEIIPASHAYVSTVIEPAVCTRDGLIEKKCSVCQKVVYETIDHTKTEGAHPSLVFVETTLYPTCTTPGSDDYKCPECNTIVKKATPKLGHNMVSHVYALTDEANSTDTIVVGGVKYFYSKTAPIDCTDGVITYTGCGNSWKVLNADKSISMKACTALNEKTVEITVKKGAHAPVFKGNVAGTCTTPAGKLFACANPYCQISWIEDPETHEVLWWSNDALTWTGASHNYIDVKAIKLADDTCTTKGEYKFICTKCKAQVALVGAGVDEPWWVEIGPEIVAQDGIWVTSTKTNVYDVIKDHTNVANNFANVEVWTKTAATCLNPEYYESYCAECGGNYRKEYIKGSETGHSYVEGNYISEAICGELAEINFVCEYCGAFQKVTERDANHELVEVDYTEWVKVDHDWKAHDLVVPQTCGTDGIGWVKCARCGDLKYTQTTDAPDGSVLKATGKHNFVYTYKAATCTSYAKRGWFCTVCGQSKGYVHDVPHSTVLTNHNYVIVDHFTVCGEDGIIAKYDCTKCTSVYYQNTNTKEIYTLKELAEKTAAKHNFEKQYLQKGSCATDVDDLYNTKVCTVCGIKAHDNALIWVPAAHTYPAGEHPVKTCTGTYWDYNCTVCGQHVFIKDSSEKYIVHGDWDELFVHGNPVHGKNNKWIDVDYTNGVVPTCTTNGYGVLYCTECGWRDETGTEIGYGHTWAKDLKVIEPASCGTYGWGVKVCKDCGAEQRYPVWAGAVAGELWLRPIKPDASKHVFEKTLVTPNFCQWDSYYVYECSVCGAGASAKQLKAIGYVSGEYIVGDEPIDVVVYHESGATYLKKVNHIVEIVPSVSTQDHVWGEPSYKDATCMNPAGVRHTCKVCGYEELVDVTAVVEPALGHDWVCTINEATCYVDGSYDITCFRCGYVKDAGVLPATLHNTWTFDIEEDGSDFTFTIKEALKADANDPRAKAATCSTYGTIVLKCAECTYEELVVEDYNPVNHKWVSTYVIEPMDCAKGVDGLAMMKCEYCNVTPEIRNIPVTHNWNEGVVTLAPNCAEEGILSLACTVAGCKATSTVAIPRTAHNMITTTREADCVNAAGVVTMCSECKLITKFVKTGSGALGHVWGNKTFVPATCEEFGGWKTECIREGCDATHITPDGNFKPLKHAGKTFVKTVAATCVEPEYKVYNCPVCGLIEIVSLGGVDPFAHAWEITKTYNSKVDCGNPGFVDMKCTLCNQVATKVWKDPDCTWSNYIYNDEYIYRFCLVCGDIESTWVSDTFTGFKGCATTDYECLTYGQVKVLVGAHKGLKITEGKDATCTEAGQITHIECTTCGTVIQQGAVIPAHTVTEIAAKAATCTEAGATAGSYCEVCKKYLVEPTVIAALGHTEVAIEDKAPTATAAGSKGGKICSVCGVVTEEPEVIEKLSATIQRLCTVRSKAADYREDNTSEVVTMLDVTDAITIIAEVENEYYKVSYAGGEGYIHMSYLLVA